MRSNTRVSSRFNAYLQKKIKINMKEWKKGRWVSQKQALAVSYSQAREYMKKSRARARKTKSRAKARKIKSRAKSRKTKSRSKARR